MLRREKCNQQTAFVFSGELASGCNLSPNVTKCETSTRIGSIDFNECHKGVLMFLVTPC